MKIEKKGEHTYEIVLDEKPENNTVIISIEAKNLRVVKQYNPEGDEYKLVFYNALPMVRILDVEDSKPIGWPPKARIELKGRKLTITIPDVVLDKMEPLILDEPLLRYEGEPRLETPQMYGHRNDDGTIDYFYGSINYKVSEENSEPTAYCKRCGDPIYSEWLTYPAVPDESGSAQIPNDDGPICDKCQTTQVGE